MLVHVVIPARYASTRLPGKPLADIAGRPMVVRVAERATASIADDVMVAVDELKVAHAVQAAGFEAVSTDEAHSSGSDRSMEVARIKEWADDDIVVNIQGDEPLIPVAIIDRLIDSMRSARDLQMATVAEPLETLADFLDPNVVKVVTDNRACAIYFSRANIPYPRDAQKNMTERAWLEFSQDKKIRRHVGIYAFRVSGLRRFVELGPSSLERVEMLEQLRWLQAGYELLVVDADERVPGGVDTPADLERVRALWSEAGG